MICLDKCYEIFDYNTTDNIDEKTLKKKYHKLCLLYHPDKTRQNKHKKEQIDFNDVQYAYERLSNLCIKNNEKNKYHNKSNNIIPNSIMDMMNNEYIYNLFKNISFEYFHPLFDNKSCITINIDLHQLFEKNIYYDEIYKIYIPLWHHYLNLSDIYDASDKSCIEQHKEISFKIQTKTPKNVIIFPNNDIIIMLDMKQYKLNEKIVYSLYEGKVFEFEINKNNLRNRYVIIYNKGIYRPNPENIYDHAIKSNIIFVLL